MPDRCGLLVYFVFGQNPETESGCIYLTLNLFFILTIALLRASVFNFVAR